MRERPMLHATLLAEADDAPVAHGTPTLRERVLSALRWCDSISAEDLFDSMGIDRGDRDACTQALNRLVKTGDVEQLVEQRPYRYRSVRK